MGFFDILAQQQAAPIEERMPQQTNIPQGVPQSPQVQQAPGQVPAQPMQAPQAAPGSTPTQQPAPEKVGAWKGLIQRISAPDMQGPLQTFLATVAAPLQPGESMVSRISYATTMARLHKGMLNENARLAPQLEKERQLKQQGMEAEIAQRKAATEASQAQTRVAGQTADYNARTMDSRVAKAEQDLKNAQITGDAARVEQAQKALDLALNEKFSMADRATNIRLKESQAAMMDRSPADRTGAAASVKDEFRTAPAAGEFLRLKAKEWANARAVNPDTLEFWDWAKGTGQAERINKAIEYYNANRGPGDPPIELQPQSKLLGMNPGGSGKITGKSSAPRTRAQIEADLAASRKGGASGNF